MTFQAADGKATKTINTYLVAELPVESHEYLGSIYYSLPSGCKQAKITKLCRNIS